MRGLSAQMRATTAPQFPQRCCQVVAHGSISNTHASKSVVINCAALLPYAL